MEPGRKSRRSGVAVASDGGENECVRKIHLQVVFVPFGAVCSKHNETDLGCQNSSLLSLELLDTCDQRTDAVIEKVTVLRPVPFGTAPNPK